MLITDIFKKFKKNKTELDDIKIYIMDDEEYYLNLVKISISKYGFNDIKIFTSGEECLLEIENEKPDCVILDYLMVDGLNGDEVMKLINKNNPDIYILVISGQEDINVAANIIKNGAYEYVVKNKMTIFNLNDTLQKIKIIRGSEKKSKNKKYSYLILNILVWVIGVSIIIYLSNKI